MRIWLFPAALLTRERSLVRTQPRPLPKPALSLVLDLVRQLDDRRRHVLCDALQRARGEQPVTESRGLVYGGELDADERLVPVIDGPENLVRLCARLLAPC